MTHEVKSYKWRGVEHLGMFLLKVPQFNYTEKSIKTIFFFSSLSDNQNPSNSKKINKKAHAAVMLTQHITAVHA